MNYRNWEDIKAEMLNDTLEEIANPISTRPWDPHCPNMEPCDQQRQDELDDELENEMTFKELCEIVIEYAGKYSCTIKESIDDLEFDGPDGSFGPSRDDIDRLYDFFGVQS
jgi:hypothetical protein